MRLLWSPRARRRLQLHHLLGPVTRLRSKEGKRDFAKDTQPISSRSETEPSTLDAWILVFSLLAAAPRPPLSLSTRNQGQWGPQMASGSGPPENLCVIAFFYGTKNASTTPSCLGFLKADPETRLWVPEVSLRGEPKTPK